MCLELPFGQDATKHDYKTVTGLYLMQGETYQLYTVKSLIYLQAAPKPKT